MESVDELYAAFQTTELTGPSKEDTKQMKWSIGFNSSNFFDSIWSKNDSYLRVVDVRYYSMIIHNRTNPNLTVLKLIDYNQVNSGNLT